MMGDCVMNIKITEEDIKQMAHMVALEHMKTKDNSNVALLSSTYFNAYQRVINEYSHKVTK